MIKYPVLYLNFKDITIKSEKSVINTITDIIENELNQLYKKYHIAELNEIELVTDEGYIRINKLKELTRILCKHTNKKVLLGELCDSLAAGNIEVFESRLNDILLKVSSFNDFSERENSYHCLLQGAFLYMLGRFKVLSNRETGFGRHDISLIPTDSFKKMYRPIIIEIKVAKESYKVRKYSDDELLELAETALNQIEERKYYEEYSEKYQKNQFILIGIGAQGKRCRVSM